MPIKPENRQRYPDDWPQIRERILKRARHCCEWPGCGLHNHSVGMWAPHPTRGATWVPLGGSGPTDFAGQGLQWPSFEPLSFAEAREFAQANPHPEHKVIVIVLTIAHLDHVPENCKPANLRAWCQRHHLAYDHRHHLTTAYMTRMASRRNLELPL